MNPPGKLREGCVAKSFAVPALTIISLIGTDAARVPGQDSPPSDETSVDARDPVFIKLIPMDLTHADRLLRRHDLDDNGVLSSNEYERLHWNNDLVRRFDLDRDGQLTHLEIATLVADKRLDEGIVQMDAVLAERYTRQYDTNGDGELSLDELSGNTFTDTPESFDTSGDGLVSEEEFVRGLAFERRFRDELGIKGCDQGGAIRLINRGDLNGDRRIDASELERIRLSDSAFDFDRNGDELLSVSELAERLAERRSRLGLTPSDQLAVRSILRRADTNRDGVISREEIPSGDGLFDGDQDGDGRLSEREVERVFGQRRRELGFEDEDYERATTLIQRNDADASRTLSEREMAASGSDRDSPISPTKIAIIDENGDRQIDAQELARHLSKARSGQ